MSWKVLVEKQNVRNEIINKIDNIYQVITNHYDKNSVGLLGGYGGCLLFLAYYYKFTQQEKHLLVLQDKCNLVFNDFLRNHGGSFCEGYSGVAWLIRFFINEGFIESPNIDKHLQEIDSYIYLFQENYTHLNDFDYLHGSLGIAYYFILQNNRNGEVAIHNFLSALENNKIDNSDGSVMWLSEVYIKEYQKEIVCNLGLAHGMASILTLLTKLTKNHSFDNYINRLLHRLILYYKNNINPIEFESVFSPWLTPENKKYKVSRLAWCYGDVGIGQSLYRTGESLQDKQLVDFALTILKKSTNRKEPESNFIIDACICHGTAGLCHIYNRLYQKTNESCFRDAALHWLNQTLMFGDQNGPFAGYQFIHAGKYISNFSLLAGLSGVGLSLLATIDSATPKWDECLMLS